MKIVLKTTAGNDNKPDVPSHAKATSNNNTDKKNTSVLNLAFGDKNDSDNTNTKEADGKHLLSRAKANDLKPSIDLFKKPKLPAKSLGSTDQPVPDLDPQLYLYDEFVSDRNQSTKKLKYLGFTDDSSKDPEPDDTTESKQSQYMNRMISIAKKRQMERDIAYEKQLLKEELKSDSNIGEVFVTGAYKKKLEERKRFEEEQRKQDEYDAIHSKNSLTKLHTYLLNTGLAKRSTGSK